MAKELLFAWVGKDLNQLSKRWKSVLLFICTCFLLISELLTVFTTLRQDMSLCEMFWTPTVGAFILLGFRDAGLAYSITH